MEGSLAETPEVCMNASASFSHHWQDSSVADRVSSMQSLTLGSSFDLYRRAKTESQGPNHGVKLVSKPPTPRDHPGRSVDAAEEIVESFSPFHCPTC